MRDGLLFSALLSLILIGPGAAWAKSCENFIKKLPSSYTSATIEVPEDWEKPDQKKITVFYYYAKKALTETPIIFFNGGPANDSHGSLEDFKTSPGGRDLPFVFIDQRGTGCSSPYPEELSRIAKYGARGIVQDAEAIRKKTFADRKWKVFGQSFGGLIVHRYVELFPENLVAAYAHGYAVMTDLPAWMAARISSQNRAWKDYVGKYPGDDQQLLRVRTKITADQTCVSKGDHRLCGPAILDGFNSLLGFASSWNNMHAWLTSLMGSFGGLDEKNLSDFAQAYVLGSLSHARPSGVLYFTDSTPGFTDRALCEKVRESFEAKGREFQNLPINECRLLKALSDQYPVVHEKPDPISLKNLEASLQRYPGLKFYLYSGKKDTFVPAETFQEEIKLLGSRISYVNFPGSGHDGYSTEPQIFKDLKKDQITIARAKSKGIDHKLATERAKVLRPAAWRSSLVEHD